MARGHEIGNDLLLHVAERQRGVIGADELRRPLERIGAAGHVKGRRRGDLPHQRRMQHVAEVDDPHDALMVLRCYQYVVEVVVVVDDLRPQRGQARQHMLGEAHQERLGEGAPWAVVDDLELGCQAVRRGNVPQQIVRRRWVAEIAQCEVQLGEERPHRPPLRGGARGLADLHAVEIGQHPHAGLCPVGQRYAVA
ncbi:hypothetical protein D9M71_403770 [compost metagenome]